MKFKIKFIALLLLLLLSFSSISFAAVSKIPKAPLDQTQATALFSQTIKNEMSKIYKSYEGNHYQLLLIKGNSLTKQTDGWVKLVTTIQPTYKTDIKKSSSAHSPYVGTLEVTTTSTFYQKRPTKEAAVKSNLVGHKTTTKYKYDFAYRDGKWSVTSAKDFDSSLNQWFDSEKDLVKNLSCKDDKH